MAQRRGTFMKGIIAGMQAYQRGTARNRQAESQRQQIGNQRLQGRMLQRQYADYRTPETPGQTRDAAYDDWKRRQDYMRENAPVSAPGGRPAGGGDGENPMLKMIDIKRANEIVSEMIMDFGDTTGMRDVWPTMVPSHIRDTATELVKSGRIGAAKGYLYSNYVFATPEAKKKITPLLKELGIDAGYDEIATIFTTMQAGIAPSSERDQERLVSIGTALREHPKMAEMFAEITSMGYDGIPFDDISPYIEEASDLLYPGGREPTRISRFLTKPYGWIAKIGSAVTDVPQEGIGYKTPGGSVAGQGMDESEAMWGALKKGVSIVKNWAKEQGRTLFDQEPEAPVAEEMPAEMPVEAPVDTLQAPPAPEPDVVRQGTPRYDELMQKIQAKDPIEEALKRNIQVRGR